jgi:hypothetical protein
MIVKFTKAHNIGIPKGTVKRIDNKLAERFIGDGYCQEATEKEYKAYLKKLNDAKVKALKALNTPKTVCKECEENKTSKTKTVCKECEEKRLNKK